MADLASSSTKIAVRAVGSVSDLDAAAWDALDHGPSPFLRYGFLAALEESGSIDPSSRPPRPARRHSGWSSVYLLAERDGRLVGAVPAFVKTHSYGEYIFDWGWANAAQRAGLPYYPKLVIAAPATPATGPRILLDPALGPLAPAIRRVLIDAVRAVADDTECSSIHWLFCTAEEQRALVEAGYFPRASLQFHWKNRGYGSFGDFLGALRSRKRKQIRKERERARGAIERIAWISGAELDQARLDDLDRFYRHTTDQHGGRDYLRPGFFHKVAKTLPESTRMVEVIAGGKRVAGALFFETAGALYGRYWGADVHVDLLHFETAYYAGIDRAIEQRLPLFEAGAQGEHKLLRGFEPSPTYSAHWIRHPGLAAAIEDYTQREAAAVTHEIRALAQHGPYRDGEGEGEGVGAGEAKDVAE
ncbi:MAG TPA: peptidogalycan biosysnthesis protein [Kofleriaceae bacterium]|nr:peptidogalycan biosysnthesis protein [Kofleriaceae bacterium]